MRYFCDFTKDNSEYLSLLDANAFNFGSHYAYKALVILCVYGCMVAPTITYTCIHEGWLI